MDRALFLSASEGVLKRAVEEYIMYLEGGNVDVDEYMVKEFEDVFIFLMYQSNILLLEDGEQVDFFTRLWKFIMKSKDPYYNIALVRNIILSYNMTNNVSLERARFVSDSITTLIPFLIEKTNKSFDDIEKERYINLCLLLCDIVGVEPMKYFLVNVVFSSELTLEVEIHILNSLRRCSLMGFYLALKVIAGNSNIRDIIYVVENGAYLMRNDITENDILDAMNIVLDEITKKFLSLVGEYKENNHIDKESKDILGAVNLDALSYIEEYMNLLTSFDKILETLGKLIVDKRKDEVFPTLCMKFIINICNKVSIPNVISYVRVSLNSLILCDSIVLCGKTAAISFFQSLSRMFCYPPLNDDTRFGAGLCLCCLTRALLNSNLNVTLGELRNSSYMILHGIEKALKKGYVIGAIVGDCVYGRLATLETGFLLAVFDIESSADKLLDEKSLDINIKLSETTVTLCDCMKSKKIYESLNVKLKENFIADIDVNKSIENIAEFINLVISLTKLSLKNINSITPFLASTLFPPVYKINIITTEDNISENISHNINKQNNTESEYLNSGNNNNNNNTESRIKGLETLEEIKLRLVKPYTNKRDPNIFDDLCPFPTPLYIQDVISLLHRSPTEEHYYSAVELGLSTLPGILYSGINSDDKNYLSKLSIKLDNAPGLMTYGRELLESVANVYVPTSLHIMRKLDTALVACTRPLSLGSHLAALVHRQDLNVGVRVSALSSLSLAANLISNNNKNSGTNIKAYCLWLHELRGMDKKGGPMSLMSRFDTGIYDVKEEGTLQGTITFRETPRKKIIRDTLVHKELGAEILKTATSIIKSSEVYPDMSALVSCSASGLVLFHLIDLKAHIEVEFYNLCSEMLNASINNFPLLLNSLARESYKYKELALGSDFTSSMYDNNNSLSANQGILDIIKQEISQKKYELVNAVGQSLDKQYDTILTLERGFDIIIVLADKAIQSAKNGTQDAKLAVQKLMSIFKKITPSLNKALLDELLQSPLKM